MFFFIQNQNLKAKFLVELKINLKLDTKSKPEEKVFQMIVRAIQGKSSTHLDFLWQQLR